MSNPSQDSQNNPANIPKPENAQSDLELAKEEIISPFVVGYATNSRDQKAKSKSKLKCYAEGSRGILCDDRRLLSFSEEKKGRWKHKAGLICKTHYDILAKIQDKHTFEERQMTKHAGLCRTERDDILIPDKEWWDEVLLPSYRDEKMSEDTDHYYH